MNRCSSIILLAGALAALPLASCGQSRRGPAVPLELEHRATVLGDPALRTWGDQLNEPFAADLLNAGRRELEYLAAKSDGAALPKASILALSGGGGNGAYGAGIICGWTASGTRPEFTVVTGVSTGALIAPFALLGPEYDEQLRQAYTSVRTRDIISRRWLLSAIFDDALFDSSPLRSLVAQMVDEGVIDALADAYARGRLLIVATTNLDSNKSVLWNVTAIAASGHPRTMELVHDVLIASASIPAAFPPVMIDVQADGQDFQEMHVDGAAKSQVFLFPSSFDLEAHVAQRGAQRDRAVFVIVNGRLDPIWENVARRTTAIARRAIAALLRSQSLADLFQIYVLTQREAVEFNLAYIPAWFQDESSEPFDPAFMTKLFDLGFDAASAPGGYPWAHSVPGMQENTPATADSPNGS